MNISGTSEAWGHRSRLRIAVIQEQRFSQASQAVSPLQSKHLIKSSYALTEFTSKLS